MLTAEIFGIWLLLVTIDKEDVVAREFLYEVICELPDTRAGEENRQQFRLTTTADQAHRVITDLAKQLLPGHMVVAYHGT